MDWLYRKYQNSNEESGGGQIWGMGAGRTVEEPRARLGTWSSLPGFFLRTYLISVTFLTGMERQRIDFR